MEWPVRLQNRLVGWGALLLAVSLVGCATDDTQVPFHMYDSPLLEGEQASDQPRSHAYDPFDRGKRRSGAVADASGATGRAARDESPAPDSESSDANDRPEKRRSDAKPDRTSRELSTARTDSEPEESDDRRASSGEQNEDQSAHAADYVWSNYLVNDVEFSDKARRSVPTLFKECKEVGKIYHSSKPDIGDIVFFHNTTDRNEDGRNNDWYTLAAIVEDVDGDGNITLMGYRGEGIERFHMNLEKPDVGKDRHGEKANSELRPRGDDDPPYTQYLAGQLFAGTCSALGERTDLRVIDNWEPGMKIRR